MGKTTIKKHLGHWLVLSLLLVGQVGRSDDRKPKFLFPIGISVTPTQAETDNSLAKPFGAADLDALNFQQPFVIDPSVIEDDDFRKQTETELSDLQRVLQALQGKVVDAGDRATQTEFKHLLDKDRIEVHDNVQYPEGRGVARQADGKLFYRLVHEQSGRAYIVYHDEDVDKDAPGYKRMIGRQLLDSGGTNWAGRKIGRDVTVVARDKETGEIKTAEEILRPKVGTRDWWSYWSSGIGGSKIRWGNVIYIGVPATIGQISLIFLWGHIVDHPMEQRVITSALAFAFSMTISTLVDGYRKFINFGSDPNQASAIPRILKHSLISFGFAYPALVAKGGWDAIALLATHITVLTNSFLHNVARGSWKLVSSSQTGLRSASGDVDVSLRIGKWSSTPLAVNRASLLEQLVLEPIMFNFKYIGLVGIGVGVFVGGLKIDAGTIALMASIPVAQAIATWNVRRLVGNIPADQRTDKHVAELEKVNRVSRNLLTLPVRLPWEITKFTMKLASEVTTFYTPLFARSGVALFEKLTGCGLTKRKLARP